MNGKKTLAFFLGLMMLMPLCALAQEEEGFGGSQSWPCFNGYNLGTSKPYVLLYEEYYNRNKPELVLQGNGREEYVLRAENLYGKTCDVNLHFSQDMLAWVLCTAMFEEEEAALEYCRKVGEEWIELYGEEYVDSLDVYEKMGAEAFFAWDWQESSSRIPFDSSIMWPSQCIFGQATVDGMYRVTMSVSMEYMVE